ncbi:MAG: hypothetical protein U0610_14370 [bacterium]
MELRTRSHAFLALAATLCLAMTGCGSDSSSGDGFDGAGPLAGVYDVVFQATLTFTEPADIEPQPYDDSAVLTLTRGDSADVRLTGVSNRTGGVCSISLDRIAESTAQIVPDQSCTGFLASDTFRTVTIGGSLSLAGNTLTADIAGDLAGSREGVTYEGTYAGTWQGTKRAS